MVIHMQWSGLLNFPIVSFSFVGHVMSPSRVLRRKCGRLIDTDPQIALLNKKGEGKGGVGFLSSYCLAQRTHLKVF
jgi:hypothetical protein